MVVREVWSDCEVLGEVEVEVVDMMWIRRGWVCWMGSSREGKQRRYPGLFPLFRGLAIRDDLGCTDRLIDWCGGYGSMNLGSLAA